MPTLAKAQLTEAESPMLEIWQRMYDYLCPNRVAILTALGFYEEHDLPAPEDGSLGGPTKDEAAELAQIATALMLAAIDSEAAPVGVLVATLKKISEKPSLFFSGKLPGSIDWIIARNYQRSDEKPATNWRDVWGDQLDQAEPPTEAAIARAAHSGMARLQKARKRGRPYNSANRILADRLGEIFRVSGQPIARRRESQMRLNKLIFVEGGPFYDFLNLVLPPLQQHLREQRLRPVTVDTIVRQVTEDFPQSRQVAR
jgi:hypothetical protein